jgi:hypothetical protein
MIVRFNQEKAMADKSSFIPDEWKIRLESVMAPGLAVTAAEPSGLWGLLQESFASGKMLAKKKMDTGSHPLIKAVVDDFPKALRDWAQYRGHIPGASIGSERQI